jgi:hypothetical protein
VSAEDESVGADYRDQTPLWHLKVVAAAAAALAGVLMVAWKAILG